MNKKFTIKFTYNFLNIEYIVNLFLFHDKFSNNKFTIYLMLAKLGNLIINENKINSYKKLSHILLILGILIFIVLPLLSKGSHI